MNNDGHPNHTEPKVSLWSRTKRLLHREPKSKVEFLDLLKETEANHCLPRDTARMMERVLKVSEMRVDEIMIPRSQMVVIDRQATPEHIMSLVTQSGHSRFPVIGETRDEVLGILLAKDLLSFYQNPMPDFKVSSLLRPAVFIPESKRLDILLNEFRKNRNHLAMVVDEYGGVLGLITIEDVLEQIVGDIEDEHDVAEDAPIRAIDNTCYLVKGLTEFPDFNRHFNTQWGSDTVATIGGLVLQHLGRMPLRGEKVQLNGFEFEIAEVDNRRLYLLKVRKDPNAETP